jgi:hypothetical protein
MLICQYVRTCCQQQALITRELPMSNALTTKVALASTIAAPHALDQHGPRGQTLGAGMIVRPPPPSNEQRLQAPAGVPWTNRCQTCSVPHSLCAAQEPLPQKHFPYWDRYGGRDHIFLMTHDEGACYMPSEVYDTAIVLTHWGRTDPGHTSCEFVVASIGAERPVQYHSQ